MEGDWRKCNQQFAIRIVLFHDFGESAKSLNIFFYREYSMLHKTGRRFPR